MAKLKPITPTANMRYRAKRKVDDEAKREVAELKPALGLRVTPEGIKDKIAHTSYIVQGILTVCLMTMSNGFTVVGKAAPVSAINFDMQRGRELAFEDAFRQLWALEGYLLRERIMRGEM